MNQNQTHNGVTGPATAWIITQTVSGDRRTINHHLPLKSVSGDKTIKDRERLYREIKNNWPGERVDAWFPKALQPDKPQQMPQDPLDWSEPFLQAFKKLSEVTKSNMEHAHHHLNLVAAKLPGGKMCSRDVDQAFQARLKEKHKAEERGEEAQRKCIKAIKDISGHWPGKDPRTWFPTDLSPDNFAPDPNEWEQVYLEQFSLLATLTHNNMDLAHQLLRDAPEDVRDDGKLNAEGVKAVCAKRLEDMSLKDQERMKSSKKRGLSPDAEAEGDSKDKTS